MNIVITGVTSGLGEALVNQFQKDTDTKIIGIYRNRNKLVPLKKKKIILIKCDFSNKKDVKNLSEKLKKFEKIDCMINNHASLGSLNSNYKKLFFLNYYSIEYITLKIFKNIKRSKKKLVINISSHAHKNITIKKKNNLSNWDVYKLSKLCLIFFSKKLASLGLNSVSINPGRMRTNFGDSYYLKHLIWFYLFLFGKDPNKIAKKIYDIAKNNNFKNGCYYSNFRSSKIPPFNKELKNYINKIKKDSR